MIVMVPKQSHVAVSAVVVFESKPSDGFESNKTPILIPMAHTTRLWTEPRKRGRPRKGLVIGSMKQMLC